jgi:hypothetical protein
MPTEPAAYCYRLYCYRLYIGETTVADVLTVLKRFDLNATVHARGYGLWRGILEPSVIVEIVHERVLDGDIRVVARALAREFNQDCVLVTRTDLARVSYVGQQDE